MLRSDGATGVRLKLHDMDRSLEVGVDLAQNLGGAYRVSDWTQQNANLYHSLRMEKVVMGILLSLIIAMGAFNPVSSQVMLVTDKQADIAILRTLGLTPGGVMQVFMVQGSLIGIFGTLAGLIGGITLTLNRNASSAPSRACSTSSCCRRMCTSPACRPTCRRATWWRSPWSRC